MPSINGKYYTPKPLKRKEESGKDIRNMFTEKPVKKPRYTSLYMYKIAIELCLVCDRKIFTHC